MPSRSLIKWQNTRNQALDNLETAHGLMDAFGAGARYARQQIIQAYATLLSSQFQAFCRDLHSECVDAFADAITPETAQDALRAEFLYGRKLEQGNPNPGNLGSDFNRFGLNLWEKLENASAANKLRNKYLERLNVWRNAVAHQDFEKKELDGKRTLSLATVQRWRRVCNSIAMWMDRVMRRHLRATLGVVPWEE